MAAHSRTLAWKIPWMEEPGGLQSMGLRRVRHGWATSLSCIGEENGNRVTPVFLPGESRGRGSLVGCRLWSRTESDTTEATQQQQQQHTHIHIWVNTFGFYKLHSLAYFCFSSRGRHMHSKYLYPHIYMSYFKSWKMMSWKCCTQYASKFGKLSSGHRTGKGQFLFQSQRKAMPKNAQATVQLHSSHMLVK